MRKIKIDATLMAIYDLWKVVTSAYQSRFDVLDLFLVRETCWGRWWSVTPRMTEATTNFKQGNSAVVQNCSSWSHSSSWNTFTHVSCLCVSLCVLCRNWCAFVQKRTVTVAVACGTEKYTIRSQSPCPSGIPDCQLVVWVHDNNPMCERVCAAFTVLKCCLFDYRTLLVGLYSQSEEFGRRVMFVAFS